MNKKLISNVALNSIQDWEKLRAVNCSFYALLTWNKKKILSVCIILCINKECKKILLKKLQQ